MQTIPATREGAEVALTRRPGTFSKPRRKGEDDAGPVGVTSCAVLLGPEGPLGADAGPGDGAACRTRHVGRTAGEAALEPPPARAHVAGTAPGGISCTRTAPRSRRLSLQWRLRSLSRTRRPDEREGKFSQSDVLSEALSGLFFLGERAAGRGEVAAGGGGDRKPGTFIEDVLQTSLFSVAILCQNTKFKERVAPASSFSLSFSLHKKRKKTASVSTGVSVRCRFCGQDADCDFGPLRRPAPRRRDPHSAWFSPRPGSHPHAAGPPRAPREY